MLRTAGKLILSQGHPKLANHFKHPKAAMERRRPGVLIAAAGAFLVALLRILVMLQETYKQSFMACMVSRSSSAFLAPAAGCLPTRKWRVRETAPRS